MDSQLNMTEYRDQFLEAFVGAKLFNMDNLANVGVMITATVSMYSNHRTRILTNGLLSI